ncbi:MAG: type II toxin-antitoxin system RelE/ParE family toxin [Magnetococcales bacterium]|nr:type II toxin-antitoxin system RelE/ParE family toxin [Magnetococcales bacterium]
MSGFVLTSKALNDLKEIGRYTEHTWGLEQRNRYLLMDEWRQRDRARKWRPQLC